MSSSFVEGKMGIFIIAEIGINHNGQIDLARDLMRVAKDAGCDAVKFQKRTLEKVYTAEFLDSPRESPWGKTQRDQKRGLEFSKADYVELSRYAEEIGISWSASAWDLESLKFLDSFDLPFHKVPSAMVVSTEFLEAVAHRGKKTFISTGMSTFDDIDRAVEIFSRRNCDFELMHCVSTYPMRDEHANLNAIKVLRERYGASVGYSGHEVGLAISYAAAALGITSLERHITLDRAMYGSDQASSIEPPALRLLVGGVRKIESAMGDGQKRIIEEEIPIARKLREHLPKQSDGYQ
jgi:N-acetylneuraminate synthase